MRVKFDGIRLQIRVYRLSDFRLFNVTSSVFDLIFFSLSFLAFLKTESNCEVCLTETRFFLRDARNGSEIVETPDILTGSHSQSLAYKVID